jgi:hypothetical protein
MKYGIVINRNFITINNCSISNWQVGIYLNRSNNTLITNNTLSNIFGSSNGGSAIGILVNNSFNNSIYSNQISNLTGGTGGRGGPGYYPAPGGPGGISTAFYLSNSFNNSIYSNQIKNADYSANLVTSSFNIFYNNFFLINRHPPVIFSGATNNTWNTTKIQQKNILGLDYIGGNVWLNATGGYSRNCTDSDNDYICDDPYVLNSNNTDYLPLRAAVGLIGIQNPPTSPFYLQANKTNQQFVLSVYSLLENITRIMIYLPDNFVFINNSNYTTAKNTLFSVSNNVLEWRNTTVNGFVSVDNIEYFYFNTSIPDYGEYSINISLIGITMISNFTYTFHVKRIITSINLNSTIV